MSSGKFGDTQNRRSMWCDGGKWGTLQKLSPETPEQHALRFPKLTEAQIAQLAPLSVQRLVEPGEVVFEQGNAQRGVFVIESGSLEIIGVLNGVETLLSALGPREFTGEVNQLSGRRSLVLCRARGDVWNDWLAETLQARGLVVTLADAAEHDRAMAIHAPL